MNEIIKGLILLTALHSFAWAEDKSHVQKLQTMSDDEMQVVSDHGSATPAQQDKSESQDSHKSHDHYHGAQDDSLSSKQQDSILYSIPQSKILPLK